MPEEAESRTCAHSLNIFFLCRGFQSPVLLCVSTRSGTAADKSNTEENSLQCWSVTVRNKNNKTQQTWVNMKSSVQVKVIPKNVCIAKIFPLLVALAFNKSAIFNILRIRTQNKKCTTRTVVVNICCAIFNTEVRCWDLYIIMNIFPSTCSKKKHFLKHAIYSTLKLKQADLQLIKSLRPHLQKNP